MLSSSPSDMYSIQSGMGDKVATFTQWSAAFITSTTLCMVRELHIFYM